MNPRSLAVLVAVPLLTAIGLGVAICAPAADRNSNYELVRLLVDVLDEVDHHYVRELDPAAKRRLVEDMVQGGLERLDPHSAYFAAQDYKQFNKKSRGKFGGIGIQVAPDRATGLLQITSPMVGTPAYEAGAQAGDLIVKIDGQSVEHLRTPEVIDRIQGDAGQPITLTVMREGSPKPVELPMTRAVIQIETVLGDRRNADGGWDYVVDAASKIAYLRVVEFDEPTAGQVKAIVERLDADGVRGLVLDLRDNPGGLLTGAVKVCDLFLTEGTIVTTRGRNKAETVHQATGTGAKFEPAAQRPLAVLVNKFSASASEIVAAALQDHGRAVIVGERSYGKGSVQNIIELEGKATALKLTTASYWRPSGKNIHRFPDSPETAEWGVTPTAGLEVKLTDEELRQFLRARRQRDVVMGKGRPPKEAGGEPFTDKVLDKALDALRAKLRG